jgi:hypothetical protein
MTVLILTCEQDVTADMVVAELDGTGVPGRPPRPRGPAGPGGPVGGVRARRLPRTSVRRGPAGEHERTAVRLGPQARRAREPGRRALRLADRGVRPGALRHAALHRRALDEPPRRGPPGPAQALAAPPRPAQRTARTRHPDHHVPAGRARLRGALPGPGGQARLGRAPAGSAPGGADQPGRARHGLRGRRLRPDPAPTAGGQAGRHQADLCRRPDPRRPQGGRPGRRPRRGGRTVRHLRRSPGAPPTCPRASPTPW